MFAPSQGVINPEQPNRNMMKSFYLLFTSFIIGFACVAQVPSYVPNDGLVAWYEFDNDVADASDNAHNGSVYGASFVESPLNGAVSFDGSDDYLEIPTSPVFEDMVHELTLSSWFKKSNSNTGTIVAKRNFVGNPCGERHHFELTCMPDNSLLFSASHNCIDLHNTQVQSAPDAFQLNEWTHVAVTYDNGALLMYVNGQVVVEHDEGYRELLPNNHWINFGRIHRSGGNPFFNEYAGDIDESGIWDRVLLPMEIQSLYQGNENPAILGCMDETACNYNSEATEDDGSCIVVNASNTVTACFGTSVSIDLGINPSVSDSEVTDNTPAQINLPIRVGNYSGEVAGFVLKSDLGPTSWSSIVHVTQSPMLTEAGKWWMPQLTELEDTCWISASNYAWNPFDKVQLIQFPVLDTLEVNSNYSVDAWDGLSGGLMVLAAQEQVIVNATLDMRGRGFRGFTHDSRVNSQDGVQGESWAGEGISSFDPNESGGGGGDGGPPGCQDGSGGGGGSSLSTGGIGLGDCGFPSNPGIPFASPTSTILLGSAGGEGGADEDGGRPGGGGNGGGAVLILCDNVQGAGLIDVGGNNGGSACQGCFGGGGSGMGGGGGGAGGSVVTPVTLEVTTNLLGGSGGPNAQCGGCTTRYGGAGSEGYVQNIDFSWTSQGLSIAWEDGQAGGIWQSSEFVTNDTISYVILANDLEVCQGEIALVGISGCNDTSACNYSETDICNNACVYPLIDNDCNAGAVACSEGTVWDSSTQTCVVANLPYLNEPGEIAELNPCYFDTNFNGLVDVTDLMNILSVFGATCAYEE